jgi:hypothetical protein
MAGKRNAKAKRSQNREGARVAQVTSQIQENAKIAGGSRQKRIEKMHDNL